MEYEDKKLIVQSDMLSPGSIAYSPWFDNSQWCNKLLFSITNDQNCDIIIYRRDNELVEDAGQNIMGVPVPMIAGTYQSYWNTCPVGYSFRIGIKNTSGVVINQLRARLQMLKLPC